MYFSFRGERKVPKESPRKESTQVLSLRILSPVRRCLFAGGQKGFMRYDFTGRRQSATSAERRARGTDSFAGTCEKFPLSSPRFRRFPRGRRSAVRAGHRVSSIFRAIRLLRHTWAKGSRDDGGFLKGGIGASLKWRSFGTFLSTGREKYTDHTPRQTQI